MKNGKVQTFLMYLEQMAVHDWVLYAKDLTSDHFRN
jgi:hypothetical protein